LNPPNPDNPDGWVKDGRPDKNGPPNPDNPDGWVKDGRPTKVLPQTGQLWWPVPVLLLAGLVLVVVGLARRKEDKYEA